MRTIEVTVSIDGSIMIGASGFKGADCEKATEFLEKELGAMGKRTRKPEYYAKVKGKQQLRAGQ